jgi:hypothetical protein
VKKVDPITTCYKAVRVNFDYWGVQGKVRWATEALAPLPWLTVRAWG